MKALRDPQRLLATGLAAIREQYRVPDRFPPDVEAAAQAAARRAPSEHADWTGRELKPGTRYEQVRSFSLE